MAGIGAGGPRALGVCLCQRFSVNRGAEHCHRARETKKTAACCVWVNDPPRPHCVTERLNWPPHCLFPPGGIVPFVG